ncbi:hypothetical protein L227DRAFT_479994, partial [Lentinus tigrinus ALCF2SS1-6]
RMRCFDCFRQPHLCMPCASLAHQLSPFHRLLEWEMQAGFWKKLTRADLRIRLHYGHNGQPCPRRRSAFREVLVVHDRGMTKIPVALCSCRDSRAPLKKGKKRPLPGNGSWPGSWDTPRTVYTVDVLRQYHLLTLQAHTTVHDFHAYLRRTTD